MQAGGGPLKPVLKNWICCQIGAREHYTVPRALHRSGRLAALYTDYWAGASLRSVAARAKAPALRSLATRFHPELGADDHSPPHRGASGQTLHEPGKTEIVSWNFNALWWETLSRCKPKAAAGEPYLSFIDLGRRFSVKVREALQRRSDLGPDSIFFAYDTGALEALEWCRQRGLKCVLNQMDPSRVEVELVRAEEQRWPGWAQSPIYVPPEYFIRREREWALAHKVVVNSGFSRQALMQQGVPPEKLVVVPLCYEAGASVQKVEIANRKPGQPLRVLFLGQVILRKGIQYLLAAARELERENIHFDVVGPIGISKAALAVAPGNVTFHGRTGRDQTAAWYRQSHLFVLPTLSDGFALTQLEAMAQGLPVIATPCCGDVVRDGVDGFVVAPRDAAALARTFQRYLSQADLLARQSAAALEKAKQFTLDRLAENLTRLEVELS